MTWMRWAIGALAGVVLALTYGLPWFFVGPVWAIILTLMDLKRSEVRRA